MPPSWRALRCPAATTTCSTSASSGRARPRSRRGVADALEHVERIAHAEATGFLARTTGVDGTAGGGESSTTSMWTISGAVSSIACFTASCSVTDDDGQPTEVDEDPADSRADSSEVADA